MRKTFTSVMLATTLSLTMAFTAFAGNWETAGSDWKYREDDGTYASGWQWIDGKSYYFDSDGIMAKETTIDGYALNSDGQWVVDGVVQTQGTETSTGTTNTNGVHHNEGYDPAHPLANAPDSWNLKLTPETAFWNYYYLCDNDNVHAMLTGQMEYYNERTGWLEDLNETEQALYQWFCDWLNGMDFENMTEMEKAQEIAKVLMEGNNYEYDENRNGYYAVLIDKVSYCTESAMTAMTLAKALGLKGAISGYGNHALYFIQVDGVAYMGSNGGLDLDYPSSYQPGGWTN